MEVSSYDTKMKIMDTICILRKAQMKETC